MREIKIRAWHPEHGGMVYSTLPTLYEKREFYPFGFEVGFSHYPEEGWAIMQYTGSKDKNGKEIYEGDILRNIHYNTWLKVVSDKACYKGEFVPHDSICGGHGVTCISVLDMSFYEVIGNIYENSLLLAR
jgi:uncharacterized phage protein (TIGR01671 family)